MDRHRRINAATEWGTGNKRELRKCDAVANYYLHANRDEYLWVRFTKRNGRSHWRYATVRIGTRVFWILHESCND